MIHGPNYICMQMHICPYCRVPEDTRMGFRTNTRMGSDAAEVAITLPSSSLWRDLSRVMLPRDVLCVATCRGSSLTDTLDLMEVS